MEDLSRQLDVMILEGQWKEEEACKSRGGQHEAKGGPTLDHQSKQGGIACINLKRGKTHCKIPDPMAIKANEGLWCDL